MFPSRSGQCVRAVSDGVQWSLSWLRVRRTSCFDGGGGHAGGGMSGMLRPEMDM